MAQYSDSHHQPSNSQLGHWGGYYIPKVLPGQGSMPNNHGIQPMETAEQDVQQQGTQYLPIPTVISGRQQETGIDLFQNSSRGIVSFLKKINLVIGTPLGLYQIPGFPPFSFPRECRKISCTCL
jgi:hypothetical protein